MVAQCNAKGAQMRTGTPRSPVEKSRSSMVPIWRRTRCGVVQTGRAAAVSTGAGGAPSEAANASPTLAAINAGHANRLAGNSGTRGISPCCCFFAMAETNCRFDGLTRSIDKFREHAEPTGQSAADDAAIISQRLHRAYYSRATSHRHARAALMEINAAALRLLKLERELVRRLGGWAGVFGMAPEIAFADQL